MIDDDLKLIFVENPKTGSYAIKMALMGHDFIHNPQDSRFATVSHNIPQRIKSQYPKFWDDYLSFVVVRNTWDRAHSYFTYFRLYGVAKSYQPMTFDEWVADGCPAPEDDHLKSFVNGEGRSDDLLDQMRYIHEVDEVIVLHSFDLTKRNEELQIGFDRVMDRLGRDRISVPIGNSQGRDQEIIHWKKDTIEILREKYGEEINYFGFKAPEPTI